MQAGQLALLPTLVDGRANPDGSRFDSDPRDAWRGRAGGRARRRYATPRRVEVVELLAARDMLPALYFIFSRAACDDAVSACLGAGLRFTETEDRQRIREIVERHVENLTDDDLRVLQYDRWLAGLEAGIAAHHAGMVPPFKEAVEACFVEGLVKVVFATETLALGINMPARTVVIEKLTKFTGERHEFLTPGQYTQLTGRAGRRGIDDHGHAVVLWSPFVTFDEVAGLASSRSFRLTSAFRPTYNMAANLVRRYPAEEAHRLLGLLLRPVPGRCRRRPPRAADRTAPAHPRRPPGRGGLRARRRGRVPGPPGGGARRRRAGPGGDRPTPVEDGLRALRPGDVLWLDGSGGHGRVAVLSVSHRKGGAVRVKALTAHRRVLGLGATDFEEPPEVVGTLALPDAVHPDEAGVPAPGRRRPRALRRRRRRPGPRAWRPQGSGRWSGSEREQRTAAGGTIRAARPPRPRLPRP